jgi:hypothetical protein
MIFKSFSCALFFYAALTRAHGGHSQEPVSGDAAEYAQRHVRVYLMHLPVLNNHYLLDGDGAPYVRKVYNARIESDPL